MSTRTVKIISEELPPPITDVINDVNVPVMFFDGSKFVLSQELVNKSGLLKRMNGQILQEDPVLFRKYVMYILKDVKIPEVDCDELHEINTIFQLCKTYEIDMTMTQLINISDSIGLQTIILDVRHLWELVNRTFRFQKKERYMNFREYWDNHVTLLSQIEANPNYTQLKNDFIINSILNLSYYDLSQMNFKYNNIIFKYGKWLHKAIKNKSFDDIKNNNLRLFDMLNGVVNKVIDNPLALINKAVEMIPQNLKDKGIELVIDQVQKLLTTSQILKN